MSRIEQVITVKLHLASITGRLNLSLEAYQLSHLLKSEGAPLTEFDCLCRMREARFKCIVAVSMDRAYGWSGICVHNLLTLVGLSFATPGQLSV